MNNKTARIIRKAVNKRFRDFKSGMISKGLKLYKDDKGEPIKMEKWQLVNQRTNLIRKYKKMLIQKSPSERTKLLRELAV